MITFDRQPSDYRHWALAVDGDVATLTLNVDEDAGLVPGYKLKLNSYDLGVDIELMMPCSACGLNTPMSVA